MFDTKPQMMISDNNLEQYKCFFSENIKMMQKKCRGANNGEQDCRSKRLAVQILLCCVASVASSGEFANSFFPPLFLYLGKPGNYFELVSEVTLPDTCFWAAGSSAPSLCMSRGGTHCFSNHCCASLCAFSSACTRSPMFVSRPASAVIPSVKNEGSISHLVRGSH